MSHSSTPFWEWNPSTSASVRARVRDARGVPNRRARQAQATGNAARQNYVCEQSKLRLRRAFDRGPQVKEG